MPPPIPMAEKDSMEKLSRVQGIEGEHWENCPISQLD